MIASALREDQPVITGIGDYAVLPTVPSAGLDELQEKAGALLDKFKALPVEQIGENANAALASIFFCCPARAEKLCANAFTEDAAVALNVESVVNKKLPTAS